MPIGVPLLFIPVMRLLMPREMCLKCNSLTLRIIFQTMGLSLQPSHAVSAAQTGEITAW